MRMTTPGAAKNIGLCVSCTTIDYGSRGNLDGWKCIEYIFYTLSSLLLVRITEPAMDPCLSKDLEAVNLKS